ncbi:bifunctional 2-polyprenyl-6-hydroxyphenol methylase/3-demethylubiquinol 3-O-methyltransferase UbiG [Mycobacterium sp.]|uniref:class I SAM-dependent methyltransferase n=1 Tax=Mycobacterium sp. TaxID=1785 RepID=UPI00126FD332|nr:class I SAM-dependent methyltransferase [Mycobacterium sp.]KAA8957731.1 MAG: class I SAM-dependent methyltransferase [Mycobacterium sp.]
MSATYWRGATQDAAMQEEHRFVWKAMLDTIDVDLAGARVLDVGCNRGGFLRLLADDCGIKEGFGYDPAASAIEDARRLTGTRPLRFEAAAAPPTAWSGFDVAFSHEVLYLLDDLPAHAAAIFRVLKPGGVYYAVMGVHADSPLMVTWHAENAEELGLPPLYQLDQVTQWFSDAGFRVAAGRLRIGFVPFAAGHLDESRLLDVLDYYYNRKIVFRFSRS